MATALAVLLPVAAIAGEPRRHDGGFFFRVAPGGGYTRTGITEDGDRLALKGTSGSVDFAIGVVSNVYLTASVGAAKLRTELEGESNDSDTGIAFDAGLR